jgi:ABC-type bacteriocin/lantibiotic exporter with double-glycine peptidase domain
VASALNGLTFAAPALRDVSQDLSQLEAASPDEGPTTESPALELRSAIQLKNVWHRYPGATEAAVRGVTLEVNRGSKFAIVGGSGSGKSTLVDIMVGLLQPTSGTVAVDGVDLRQLVGWQKVLGLVSQEPYIADDSILNNIAFGVPGGEVDRDRVRYLTGILGIDSFMSADRGGLDMPVGELGVGLSGGQRQRLALARALYRRPQVLVLDEATSALDVATEAEVLKAVHQEMSGGTIITVAHRASAIAGSDTVMILGDGYPTACGPYSEIVRSAFFARLMQPAEVNSEHLEVRAETA